MHNNHSKSNSRSRTNERRYINYFYIIKLGISIEGIEKTLSTEMIEGIVSIVAIKVIAEIDNKFKFYLESLVVTVIFLY